MLKKLKQGFVILLATWAFVLMPTQAMAYTVLQCNANGTVMPNTQLFYDHPGATAGDPSFCSEINPRDPNDKTIRIFSNIICSFVVILNDVLGKIYCGFQYTLKQYVAMIITVYIAIFGVQILMGTTQLNAKEMLVRFLKIGLVWAFVSNYNWGVDLLFLFFIDFANEGIWWTLGSIQNGSVSIRALMNLPSYGYGVSGAVPAYVYIDQIIYGVISGPFVDANSKLIAFFALLAFAFPPIFMIAAYWLWTTFMIIARTMIAFMMSLSAIAFLVALSPIFFCLMLFQPTYQFFETWLKYMISFSLQVVIVFACVAMWIMAMTHFIGFFDQLSKVIFKYEKMEKVFQLSSADKSVGICPYIVSQGTDPAQLLGPNIKCANPNFDPFAIDGSTGELTEAAKFDNNALIDLGNIAPSQQAGSCQNDPNCMYGDETPDNAPQHRLNRLNYFVIYHLMTLIIVAYAFDALLKQAPYIAKELAGPQYVPILGQGFGGLGYHAMKGVSKTRDTASKGGGIMDRIGSSGLWKTSGNAVGEIMARERQMATNTSTGPLGRR